MSEIEAEGHVLLKEIPLPDEPHLVEISGPAPRIRILTPEEEDHLLGICHPEDRAMILCALDTLQRLSAVAHLTREADKGTSIEFLNLKTLARLSVPVSSRLRRALDALPVYGPWLFPWVHWGPMPGRDADSQECYRAIVQQRVEERFRTLCLEANIDVGRAQGGVTFDCLRHTGAARMLRRGVDPKTVMEIGGWASLKMLEKYMHSDEEHKIRAVEAVGSREESVKKGRQTTAGKGRPRQVSARAKVRPFPSKTAQTRAKAG